MLKNTLFILCLVCSINIFSQEESFARYIKASPADTLLPIATTVKEQLQKEMNPSKKASQNARSRLVLMGSNKETAVTITRWLAAQQQQDTYYVNWGTAASKYIGETEKNLELLFLKATATNAVLFFDEADALFGLQSDAGSNENNPALAYWLKQISEYKGTILIACSGNDCLATFGKRKFTGIQLSAPMKTQ